MGRGPGRWQRFIAEQLTQRNGFPLREVPTWLDRPEWTASEYQALYRAARELEARGQCNLVTAPNEDAAGRYQDAVYVVRPGLNWSPEVWGAQRRQAPAVPISEVDPVDPVTRDAAGDSWKYLGRPKGESSGSAKQRRPDSGRATGSHVVRVVEPDLEVASAEWLPRAGESGVETYSGDWRELVIGRGTVTVLRQMGFGPAQILDVVDYLAGQETTDWVIQGAPHLTDADCEEFQSRRRRLLLGPPGPTPNLPDAPLPRSRPIPPTAAEITAATTVATPNLNVEAS